MLHMQTDPLAYFTGVVFKESFGSLICFAFWRQNFKPMILYHVLLLLQNCYFQKYSPPGEKLNEK